MDGDSGLMWSGTLSFVPDPCAVEEVEAGLAAMDVLGRSVELEETIDYDERGSRQLRSSRKPNHSMMQLPIEMVKALEMIRVESVRER